MPSACEAHSSPLALGMVACCYDSQRQHGHLLTQVRAPTKVFDYNNICFSLYIQSFREEKGSFEMIRYLIKVPKESVKYDEESPCVPFFLANRGALA